LAALRRAAEDPDRRGPGEPGGGVEIPPPRARSHTPPPPHPQEENPLAGASGRCVCPPAPPRAPRRTPPPPPPLARPALLAHPPSAPPFGVPGASGARGRVKKHRKGAPPPRNRPPTQGAQPCHDDPTGSTGVLDPGLEPPGLPGGPPTP